MAAAESNEAAVFENGETDLPDVEAPEASPSRLVEDADEAPVPQEFMETMPGYGGLWFGDWALLFNDADAFSDAGSSAICDAIPRQRALSDGSMLGLQCPH